MAGKFEAYGSRIPGRKLIAPPAATPAQSGPLTAQEAAEIADRAAEPRPDIVKAVEDCYWTAIRDASAVRRKSITHTEPDRPRTPIRKCETEAVWQVLREKGFRVDDEGVSW